MTLTQVFSEPKNGKSTITFSDGSTKVVTLKTKTEIKRSDIAAKAKEKGYSVKEYTQLLIDKGINIID